MWKQRYEKLKTREEILILIKPLFNYFLFSGMFPYRLIDNELKLSKIGIIPLLINLGVMLLGYSHLFIGDPFNEIISKIEQTQFATISILLLILFIFQFKSFRKNLYNALDIGSEILDVKNITRKFKILMAFEVVISSFLITSLHIAPILLSASYNPMFYESLANKLYVFFLYFTNNFFLLECIVCNLFFYIKECFASINDEISSIVDSSNKISLTFLQMNDLQNNRITLNKLTRIVKIRQKLLELTIDINKMCFVILLSSSWISLFEIMFSAYYAVVFIFDQKSYDSEQLIFHNYLIAWMLYHALRFIFVCFACGKLTEESEKTGRIIQKLINNCRSKNITKKLYEYSHSLHNYKLQISAMRFFNVDLTLCNNVISGIFTYLIILLQFRFTPSPSVKVRYDEILTQDELTRQK